MEVPSTIYVATGAVIAAFITGFFSFVNLIISKEQKISEFRQQWIDCLRDDISEFTSQTEFIASMFDHMRRNTPKKLEDPEEVKKFVESISENLRESINMYHRIQLRVNREEHRSVGKGQVLSFDVVSFAFIRDEKKKTLLIFLPFSPLINIKILEVSNTL